MSNEPKPISINDCYAENLGIPLYDSNTMTNKLLTRFFRYGYWNVQTSIGPTKEFIFITKPDLHLMDGGSINPELQSSFFKEIYDTRRDIFYQLQISSRSNPSPFIAIFSNTVKSTLDLPSIDGTETENSATSLGESVTYMSTSIASDSNHEFSLEFEDDKFLTIYKLLKTWDMYAREKDKGLITPPNIKYTLEKTLHDQVSAYKFIVDEDNETIIYYAKLWGVYPKRVPRDAFSSLSENTSLTLPVSFHAQWVEDVDPMVLADFNSIVSGYKGSHILPIWDTKTWQMNMKPARCPYIQYTTNTSMPGGKYKLVWTD